MRRDHGDYSGFYESQEAPDGHWWLLAFVVKCDQIEVTCALRSTQRKHLCPGWTR